MTLGTRLYTLLFGELVGEDELGNRYFRGKRAGAHRRGRRWVLYSGEAEASRVPPEWHAWLHHMVEHPPSDRPPRRYPWQKQYEPNLTGTPAAYHPPGHEYEGGQRPTTTGDYEPWRPS